jgi:hypothetical protein
LALKVSRFLAAEHRDHVVGVVFFSRSDLLPAADGLVDSGGTAYYFPKRESPFWHDDLSGLFGKPPRTTLPNGVGPSLEPRERVACPDTQ